MRRFELFAEKEHYRSRAVGPPGSEIWKGMSRSKPRVVPREQRHLWRHSWTRKSPNPSFSGLTSSLSSHVDYHGSEGEAPTQKQPWDANSTPMRCACQEGTAISCIVPLGRQESHRNGAIWAPNGVSETWAAQPAQCGFREPPAMFSGAAATAYRALRKAAEGLNAEARVSGCEVRVNYTNLVQVWKRRKRRQFAVPAAGSCVEFVLGTLTFFASDLVTLVTDRPSLYASKC